MKTDLIFGVPFVFAKIQVGIITHQHRTDLKQTGWQNAQSGESKNVRHHFLGALWSLRRLVEARHEMQWLFAEHSKIP